MKVIFSLVFVLGLLLIASPVHSQTKELSEKEYKTALAEAVTAASSRNRRVLTEESFYTGSQVTGTRKIISDFAGPDARKVEVVEEFNGKRPNSDSVRIGEQFFCREGDKGWKRSNKECANKVGAMVIPAGDYEYFVEPDPDNYGRKIYTRRATYTDAGSPARDSARLKFIEIKFVIDATGAIVEYTETRRGGIEPNGWSSTQVTKYEYEPAGLRISDPTRQN